MAALVPSVPEIRCLLARSGFSGPLRGGLMSRVAGARGSYQPAQPGLWPGHCDGRGCPSGQGVPQAAGVEADGVGHGSGRRGWGEMIRLNVRILIRLWIAQGISDSATPKG